ncbi:MAG: hypothetical protein HS110_10465 [Zoogloeaceae bacterium]|nr:hypothetical protein [Zoogloeaceae bacterium]MCK6385243.1 hypothetical protein [Rhodocyclaceae bacterium]
MSTQVDNPGQLKGAFIHSSYWPYIIIDRGGMLSFMRAIATNAVGQAITLAAIGAAPKDLVMPNMGVPARCRITLHAHAWVNNLKWVDGSKRSQERYLEIICRQISGPVAEHIFDDLDHYGSLGLADIQGADELMSAYESTHGVSSYYVLGAATCILEGLLSQHYEIAIDMIDHLHQHGRLNGRDLKNYLGNVGKEKLGDQVLAALQNPSIEADAHRAERLFIGL